METEELVMFHAREISNILDNTERQIQKGASDYEKEHLEINAYEQIIDVINDIY